MIRPYVTVIVPVFNSERHVRETLESIASQTLRNLEVIVVDDGSTDSSVAIVEEFISHDERFRLEAMAPQGSAGAARNIGLGLARGDYLAFLDADDLFEPTMLQKLHSKARADDADIAMTAFRSFDDATGRREPLGRRGRLHAHLLPKETPFGPEDIGDHIFTAPHTTVWNKLFKTEFIRRIGAEFEPVRRSNDAYFNMITLAQARRLTYVNEPLVNYRASNENSLQGSQSDVDFSWADASRAVANDLKALRIYDRFRRAMIQRVATRAFDRLSKATTPESYAEVYETIRYSLFPEFELDTADASDFPDPAVGRKVGEFLRHSMTEWLHAHPPSTLLKASAATPPLRNAPEHEEWKPEPVAALPDSAPEPADASVVVPVPADSPHVTTCIRSVLAQNSVHVELILVVNDPVDALANVDEGLRKHPRLRVVVEPNLDDASMRNAGVAAATGRYVMQLDANDYWFSHFLASTVDLADERQADLLILEASSVLDGVARTDTGLAGHENSHTGIAIPTTAALLARYRRTRHLRERVGVLLVRRAHLVDIELRFPPGVSTEIYTLSLLMRSERVVAVPVTAYAHRVQAGAFDSRDDVVTAAASLRRHVALRRLFSSTRIPEDAAADADAILEESLAHVTDYYTRLSRRERASLRTAAGSSEASEVCRHMELALRREARHA